MSAAAADEPHGCWRAWKGGAARARKPLSSPRAPPCAAARFPSSRCSDGIHILNTGSTMDKLQIAARIIVTIDNPSGALQRARGRAVGHARPSGLLTQALGGRA